MHAAFRLRGELESRESMLQSSVYKQFKKIGLILSTVWIVGMFDDKYTADCREAQPCKLLVVLCNNGDDDDDEMMTTIVGFGDFIHSDFTTHIRSLSADTYVAHHFFRYRTIDFSSSFNLHWLGTAYTPWYRSKSCWNRTLL